MLCIFQLGENMKKITEKVLYDIPFFHHIEKIEEIHDGYSGSKTYKVTQEGLEYFTKICDVDYQMLAQNFAYYKNANILVPKLFEIGKVAGYSYYVTEFIQGTTLKEKYNQYNEIEIYEFGKNVGVDQKNLSKLHPADSSLSQTYFLHFQEFANLLFAQARSLVIKHQKDMNEFSFHFFQSMLKEIDDEKEELLNYFKKQNPVYLHSDIRVANFILKSETLYTIDYEESCPNYLSYVLRSEFYSMMKGRPLTHKSWYFIRGVIDGFFEGDIPESFYEELKFIFFMSLAKRLIKRLGDGCFDLVDKIAENLSQLLNHATEMDFLK